MNYVDYIRPAGSKATLQQALRHKLRTGELKNKFGAI